MALIPSEEEKQMFLALMRAGKDPVAAAQIIDSQYTASTFRRLTNETNPNYDADFASDYWRARADFRKQNLNRTEFNEGKPKTTTLSGHLKAAYLTEEMLEEFLDHVAQGVPLMDAVKQLEPSTTLTQIHRRASRDKDFADAYAKAKEIGYPIFQEKLRSEAIRQAFNGDYRALRDQLMIHVPEFKQLVTSRHEVVGGLTSEMRVVVERALPSLPRELLDEMIRHIEENEPKLIEQ
jgi:hypothetical protein